ncbi:MAG: hypothetical protein HQM11_03510 [SAR324 cluster bacterium]|nr:hypothetical protein [SAR324 cluster bacterium]
MKTISPQITAHISSETQALLETYIQNHGVKKGFFVESAILHYLQALNEIPFGVIIPPKIVVSKDSGEYIVDKLENPPPPTPSMQSLYSND